MSRSRIFILILFFYLSAQSTPRIQQLFLNRSTSQKIYLSPGLATSVKMPCEIDEVVTPQSGILKHISERNKARFSLEITQKAQSTNFIVHCIDQTFVFDLIVNRMIHNDYIEVIGDYGEPRLTQVPSYKNKSLIKQNQKNSIVGLDSSEKVKKVLSESLQKRKLYDLDSVNKVKVYSSEKFKSSSEVNNF